LSEVRKSGQTAKIPVFPLSQLIHNQPGEYFTYWGKIDKRGCKSGIIQWIVFTKTCDVNREQVHLNTFQVYARNIQILYISQSSI